MYFVYNALFCTRNSTYLLIVVFHHHYYFDVFLGVKRLMFYLCGADFLIVSIWNDLSQPEHSEEGFAPSLTVCLFVSL